MSRICMLSIAVSLHRCGRYKHKQFYKKNVTNSHHHPVCECCTTVATSSEGTARYWLSQSALPITAGVTRAQLSPGSPLLQHVSVSHQQRESRHFLLAKVGKTCALAWPGGQLEQNLFSSLINNKQNLPILVERECQSGGPRPCFTHS